MESELDNLIIDLKSDKVQKRGKAFGRLKELLSTQHERDRKLICSIVENSRTLSWNEFFKAAHQGVIHHATKMFKDNKQVNEYSTETKTYSEALNLIVQGSSIESKGVSYLTIVEYATQVLTDEALTKYFGKTYLIILERFVLVSKNNLTQVTTKAWKLLLKRLLSLMKSSRHNQNFVDLLSCASETVDLGCSFSHLASELVNLNLFSYITTYLEKRTNDREKLEILTLAYKCCKHLLAEHREDICKFVDSIVNYLVDFLRRNDLPEKHKTMRIKLFDLIIVAHCPNLGRSDQEIMEFIPNRKHWTSCMREFDCMINTELQQSISKYRDRKMAELNPITAQCAARFCYYFHWNDTRDLEEDEEDGAGPSTSKRARIITKVEYMVDKIKPSQNEVNWKWLVVFAELIYNYRDSVESEDVPEILKMLTECQPQIDYSKDNIKQIYAFTKCCAMMIRHERKIQNQLVINRCKELWNKIGDEAVRVGNANGITEAQLLLQLLIQNDKCLTSSFIEGVLKMIITGNISRNDATLKTLITVLKKFNLDSLANGKELSKMILNYAFQKHSIVKVIVKPSYTVLSELATLCCLLKTDVVNYVKKNQSFDDDSIFETFFDLRIQMEYIRNIEKATKLIRNKNITLLLLEDEDFLKIKDTEHPDENIPTELKCIVDQQLFEILMNLTEPRTRTIDEHNTLEEMRDYIRDVLDSNELMMHLASNLLRYHALNEEKFNSSFIVKRIVFHIQEIERLFQLVAKKVGQYDLSDTFNLLTSLKAMFSAQYHSVIAKRVLSSNLKFCLNWIYKQVDRELEENDDDKIEQPMSLEAFVNAKNFEKIRFLAITTICQYFYYEGANVADVLTFLDKIDFYMDDNMDLHTILEVIDLFSVQSKLPAEAVSWIWKAIINVCQMHKNCLYIMGRVCEKIDKIVKITKNVPDEVSNLCVLVKAFASMCTHDEPKVNREVSIQFLEKFPTFHRDYFKLCYDESPVKFVYMAIANKFLKSKSFSIKMAAIKCFCTIMNFDIDAEVDIDDMEIVITCRNDLYNFFCESVFDNPEIVEPAFRIQLCCALFCTSYHLRKRMLFEIARLFYIHKCTMEVSIACFNKILNYFNCGPSVLIDNNNLIHLITEWINNELIISLFPFYFLGCQSNQIFLETYFETILLALMKNDYTKAHAFLETAIHDDYTIQDAFYSVFGDYFAYVLPIKAGCVNIKYEEKATILLAKLNEVLSKNEQLDRLNQHLPEIINKVLINVIDVEKFKQISGIRFDFYAQDESINMESFEKCMNYLNKKVNSKCDNLITFLCTHRKPYIENLFMRQRSRIQGTELKEHKIIYLLQYCILVELTFGYMKDTSIQRNSSIKEFLIREFVTFLVCLINDNNYGTKLRQIAANFLAQCLKEIITSCVEEFKPQMNKIMPELISIATKTENSMIISECDEIIKFLVMQPLLSDEVARMDRFPERFEELRNYQRQIKYSTHDFSLVEEIEHFLQVKNRNVEGLKELCDHLAKKKIELKALFEKVATDGDESVLYKLLRNLIEYIQMPNDEVRAIEAIKCLGEIGSHNLSKIVFNADSTDIYQPIEGVQQCQKIICFEILNHMEELLLHRDNRVFEASSSACHHIFMTLSSQGYPESPYFRPFQCDYVTEVQLFYFVPKVDKLCEIDIKGFFENNKLTPYTDWLRAFCILMMKFAGDKVLSEIPSLPVSIVEAINSKVFQLLIYYDREEINHELLNGVNHFFLECNEAFNYKETTNEGSIFIDKKAIREMLKNVEIIRMFVQNNAKSNMARIWNLNYLHIAKAAKYCEAFFTAIMWSEMWAQRELEEDAEKTFKISIQNKDLQDIMYHSYAAIGIKDTFEIFLNPFTSRKEYLSNTKHYFQLLLEANSSNESELAEICQDAGLHHLINKFIDQTKDKDKAKQYDCLWRLSQWDAVVETEQQLKDENGLVNLRGEFSKYHYLALQCLKNGDEVGSKGAVDKARKIILDLLSQQSLECTQILYNFMEMTHRLVQIEDFGEIRFKRTQNAHETLLKKWSIHDSLPFDFDQYEKIILQRSSIFDTANIKSGKRTWIPNANKANLLFAIKQAIIAGRHNVAYNIITKMKGESIELSDQMELLIEESKLNIKDDLNLAKKCLLNVIEEKKIERDYITKSSAHRLYGEILAENYAMSVTDISKKHFEVAQTLLIKYAQAHEKSHLVPNLDNQEQLTQFSQSLSEELDDDIVRKIKSSTCIFDTMAKYFDREYVNKSAYMNSQEYENKRKIYDKNVKNLAAMNADGKINKAEQEVKKSYITLQRSIQIDKEEFKTLEKEKKSAARNAIYNYVRSTIQSTDNDILNIFRIISLTLENCNVDSFIQEFLSENLPKIQSYKFIVAIPQITVRITNNDGDMLNVLLKSILERCSLDHPHHTLPSILALKNSDKDAGEKKPQPEPRVIGATQLWTKLKKNKKISPIMDQLEEMSTALIEYAYVPLSDKNPNQIPKNQKLLKLKNKTHLQCPTVELNIRKNGFYKTEDLTYVVGWESTVASVGGINAPKKIEVLCSDGILRSQLLKGRDDMRQDAIMQQIFGVVNQLLVLNKEMKMKQAKIRTYRVVPFSRRSGILEWCLDTMPIGMYLVGNSNNPGAHQRLRPQDWQPYRCLKALMDNDTKNSEVKINVFNEICQNFKPVMHHFFYEKFNSPGKIFERRFAYTISVAVSSIIGYILGIGDRHVQNILIDVNTAEVIHIDFGVAFEAGKCLPHPEHVPFRLTRDIVAPMGVSGVDGIFRKTCEKTLEILREHEKTLTTILEVLLYDPMYTWSVGAKLARAAQLGDDLNVNSDEENHDAMASRALQRVKAKLSGFADDTATRYPSIDGQVQYLIQAATDVGNLAKLFRGWQAYL